MVGWGDLLDPILHQAEGMISVQGAIGVVEAARWLDERARIGGRTQHDVAADVVGGLIRFDPT
jgi:hypothetical protein